VLYHYHIVLITDTPPPKNKKPSSDMEEDVFTTSQPYLPGKSMPAGMSTFFIASLHNKRVAAGSTDQFPPPTLDKGYLIILQYSKFNRIVR
jgi:hypothetical protein